MGYRLRYRVEVDYVAPGLGQLVPAFALPGEAGGGNAQTLAFFNQAGGQNVGGSGTGTALTAADVTTLTNAMAVDIAAQMNLSLTRLAAFPTGGT